MKLLFYINSISGGGAERVLCTLLKYFSENKDLELCLATSLSKPFAYIVPQKVRIINLTAGCKTYNKSVIKHFLFYRLPYFYNIRKIARNERPDVIIAFMGNCISNVILMTIGLGIPIIGSEHTNVTRSFGKLFEIKRNILYPLASVITVLTKHDYSLWQKKFNNIVLMPNPCDFVIEPDFNVRERKKRVLAIGRVCNWDVKGFDNLIRAWAKVCASAPDWKLTIVGETNESSIRYLTKIINDENCVNVEFLGFRTDIDKLLLESEIFVLSSRIEGLPMSLIEAMKSGCCCVSFDVQTGPNEIIVDGYSGLLVKDQDILDLATKLNMVIHDKFLRRKLAANSYKTVEQYSINNVLEKWYSLLNIMSK